MNRDDDQHLWDLLGRAPRPRLSAFFSRNVLRQVRQEPVLLKGNGTWLNWKVLVPASGLALVLAATAAIFLRGSSTGPPPRIKEPERVAVAKASRAPRPEAKIDAAVEKPAPAKKIEAQTDEFGALATIDEQDYDTIANLDDLLVLYETSLWDENTSL